MPNLINVIGAHVFTAVIKNWFSTLVGVLGAIALAWPALSDKYLAGHDWNTVDWKLFAAALGSIAWGAISKFAVNWKSIMEGITNSVPRAAPVAPKIEK